MTKPDNPPAFPFEVRRVDWLPPDVAFLRDGPGGRVLGIIKNIGTGTPEWTKTDDR